MKRWNPFLIVLAGGLGLAALGQAMAQDAKPAAATANAAPAAVAVEVTTTVKAEAKPETNPRNIRFQFEGIPYNDVLERFSQMVNKPMVSDTNVQGTLSFNDPQPYNYGEALDMLNLMLSMKGVMLIEDGHYLRLVGMKQLPQMPLRLMRGTDQTGDVRGSEIVTVVLDVKNLDTKEVGEAVLGMLSNAGSLAPLSKGRGLIITDRLANIQRVRSLLAAIDQEAVADRQMRAFTLLHASGAVVSDLLNRTFGAATAPKRTQYNPNTKNLDTLPADPSDYITSVYDEASRTLVLFGPRERLGLAEELIAKFEDKEGGAGDVRIYYPQAMKADELAQMIRQAIPGIAGQGETAASAATKARLIVDSGQNRLIVAAPIAAQIDQIEILINRVDKPVHGTGSQTGDRGTVRSQTIQMTKVFRPRSSQATNVAEILTKALSRRLPSGQTMPTANVTVDPNSQSVVVTGSPGDVQMALDIVTQLETGSTRATPQQTRFIDVGTVAEAKRLLPLVEEIYRSQAADSLPGQTAHAKIMADTEGGRLIVTASEDHLQRIDEIVKQLRTEQAKTKPRTLHLLALKNVRVDTAMPSINNLVNERMSEKQFADMGKPLLMPDAANNRLLVTATEDQFKAIQEVVKTLDVAPEKAKRDMAVIPVHAKPAAELITLTTQLMGQVIDEQLNPQLAPKLIADSTGRQIIVLATASDLERITNLVHQLDRAAAETTGSRQSKSIELFSRTAAELSPLVQQLYQEHRKGTPEPAGGAATLLAEAKNNRILVSGSEKEIARVEALIRQLDPEEKKGQKDETRVIRLKAGLAADLAALVEKSLGTQSQRVKVLVDTRSNSLVISGDASAVEAAAQIVNQLDTRSDVQPRELRILELKQGDAHSMMALANNLFVEMIKDQRGPEYVPQTKIIPDPTGNRLIVTGPKEELKTVTSVVEQLDQAPEASGGARVFKLTTADAGVVVSVVSNAMMRFDARNQPIRRVSISVDRESNSIVVSGPRAELQDAGAIIERLDKEGLEGGSGGTRELKVVEVRTDDPDALAAMAMKVFASQNAGRNITNILSITPEPSGKRLIVLAPSSLLSQLDTVISTLDAKPEQGARELQVVEVKNATAAEVLPVVNRIYSEQNQGKTTKPASLYPDSSGSRLMVYGTRDQGAAIRQIVETLESQTRSPRESRTFELGKLAEAQRLLPLIQQLYRDQLSSNPVEGPADAQMMSDGRTGKLIISARTNQLPRIEQIIASLKTGSSTNELTRETKAFEVGNAGDVQRLLPLVQQLYQDQWKDRNETDPADAQIMGDARTGRLIVSGKPEHVRQIEAIVQQLTAGKTRADGRDTRVFDLTTANAMDLANTVRTLYLEQAKIRLGNTVPDTLIMPDATANRLILVGETNEVAEVEEIVKKLDKVGAQSASVRVFKLRSADPAQVAQILSTALVRYDAYGRMQRRVSVVSDAQSRTLVATGDPKELQGLSVIIEQLDSAGAKPERKMKVVAIKFGRSYEISAKLRQLYNDQLKSQPDLGTTEILILEEAPGNQIILAGTEDQLTLLDKILSQLELARASQPQRDTKIIEFGQADEMQRLLPLLQQLYQERWRDRSAGDPADTQMMPDPINARLIVTGKTNHIAEIEAILAQLRDGKTPGIRDTRIFDLTTANAAELAVTVRSLYLDQAKSRTGAMPQETLILPDMSANRLIVAGVTNELDQVEEIIKKLDKVSAQSGTVRLFKLKSADPAKVLEILGNTLTSYDSYGRARRRVGVTLDAKTRTIIVAGDPKELQSLQNAAVIIEQLDNALGQQAERKIKVLTLKKSKVVEMSPKVRQLYNDQLSSRPELASTELLIMEDAPSNQMILAGSEAQLSLIEKIIEDLQTAQVQQGQRETKLIEIGQADEIERLLPLVQQLYQEHWRDRVAGDPADAQIVADTRNARFIVTARTNHIAEIETIVAKLRDGTTNTLRETRIYDLTTATAVDLAATVKSLYQEQAKNRPGIRIEDTAILPDASANRLIVTAATNELEIVEDIIKKLDKVSAQSASVRVFKVKSAEPEKVAEILTSALVTYDSYGRPRKRVSISVDPKSRTIIAAGDPKELQGASVVIEQLDTTLGGQPERRMKVLPVKAAKLSELMTKVRAVYDDQVKAQPELGTTDVLILEDTTSNQLILAGTEKQIKLIEEITSQLETSALVQEPRQTRVYELTSSSAQELAATVKSLYQEALKGQPTSPASQALVMPDVNANRLIVSATTNDLVVLDDIIAKIDKTEAQTGRTRVFKLKSAEAQQVATILSTALVQVNPYGRSVPRVSVGIDTPNNLLIVSGMSPQDLQAAAVIVDQMDQMLAKEPRQLRVVGLKNGLASEVATRVKQLYQDQLKGQATNSPADALIMGDDTGNRLVITASESQMKLIETIVNTLQETGQGTGRQLRVVYLERNSANTVATMITQLFARQVSSQDPSQRVAVSASADDRVVVIDAAGEMLEKLEQLVKTLDGEELKGRVEVRTYKFPEGNVGDLVSTLSRLFAERGGPAAAGLSPRFEADTAANVLMVAATKEQLNHIDKLIEDLKQTVQVASEIRTFKLQHSDPAQVASVLESMLTDSENAGQPGMPRQRRMQWRPGIGLIPVADAKSVRVVPAPLLSAVVVQGPPEKLMVAEKLIQTLDDKEALGRVEVRTYQLPEGNATELAQTLARLFAERSGGKPVSANLGPRFEADAAANVLMVAAGKEQFVQIDKLIDELKKTAQVSNEIRTFKLQNGDPTQVAEVLEAMLLDGDAQRMGRRRRPQNFNPEMGGGFGSRGGTEPKMVRVAPAPSLNAVVVQGPPEKLMLAEKLIQTLDKTEMEGRSVIQTVHLKKAHAEDLAPAVTRTLTNRLGQASSRITVTPVIGPNSLLLNGPAETVQEVMQIIHELDQESESDEIKVHIYKLENGNAKEVSELIQDLLQGVTRTQMRLRPTSRNIMATVSVDERSNSLIISGTPSHFKVVDQMLQVLDKVPERAERDVQFVWLRNAKSVDVASKLEAVFASRSEADRPVIEADLFNNSITIIGKRGDILQAEALVNRLDESSKDSSLQVRLRPMDRIPVDQMAEMLKSIYPQMSAGRIRIVEKLPVPTQKDRPAPLIVPAVSTNVPAGGTNAPAAPGRPAELEEAEVVIAIDKKANALLLSGPTHELDQIDTIITDLMFSYVSSDAEFRVFPMKEADPVIVARTLTDLFRPDAIQIQQQHQQQQQQQQQQAQPGQVRTVIPAPKITVVAEPRTRSVIVRAKPTDFTLMETLIRQLDVAGLSSQLEFRVVALTNAPPEKVAPLVQQMVTQLSLIRPGEPLTVTPDSRSHGLLVVARDTVLTQVERMIHSLDTPSQYAEAEVLVVSLKRANANQLAVVLQGMLKPGTAGELTPEARELQEQVRRLKVNNDAGKSVLLDLTKPIKIMADPLTGNLGGNRLVLSSTPDNLKALAAVVEMMDAAPVTEGVSVRLVHLEHADSAAVAQTLNIIFAQGQRLAIGPGGRSEPEGNHGKALVHPLNVTADPRSNSLILSGQKEGLELAQKLINDLDRKVERFTTEVKLFRLKHASAIRMAPLLQSVFAEGPSVPGTEGLSTQVTRLEALKEGDKPAAAEVPKSRTALTIRSEDTSNILIVAARKDTLPLIEAVIEQLDIPAASGLDTIRIYPLQHADATLMQKLIMDLYTGPRAAQLRTEDKPNITIDDRTQALIVAGNTKAFGIIEGLMEKLDRELPLELRDVRIMPLEHADAFEIAATIQRLLDARITQRAGLSKAQADAMRVLVLGEPRSNSLLIAGSKDGFELVESLAEELDSAPAALSGRIRLVPLTYSDSRFLSTALNNLFAQRYQAAKSPETQRNKPIIVPDPRSNALLVAAGVDDNQTIDDLVLKLDRKLEDPAMTLTVIGLKHNDAGKVGPTLENIFSARLRSRVVPGQPPSPQDAVEIQTDSLNNALIVSASRENIELLNGLLEKIDVEPVAADGIIQTFTLEYADAQRIASMLRTLVQQGLYRPGTPSVPRGQGAGSREAMAVTVDSRSNTLIVSASPENLLVIKEVIKQVDTKDFADLGDMRLFQLKHAKASTLSTVLLQFFRAKRQAESISINAAERSVMVTVIPDDRSNTLLVAGGKESFDAVERVIQQLDGEDVMARMNFRVFSLKQSTAAKLQDTLQRLFANRPARIKGEPPEPITVVADAWVNALIVGASVDDMGMVATLIERLDGDQGQLGLTVQVISLAKADARRVAQTVQALYREGTPGTSLPVVVSADDRLNAVVVSAGESDIKRILDLVKKLDTDQVARVSEIKVFGLKFARADSLATILNTSLNSRPASLAEQNPNTQSLLQFITRKEDGQELVTSALKEPVLITPDARMNSLIVSAPADYMNLLEQIIVKLDTGKPQEAKIRVFALRNADARQMADLLTDVFRLQPTGVSGNQRSIQYTLVKSTVNPELATDEMLDEVPVEETDVASATLGTAEQNALTVNVDPRTNSLLIGGTDHYVELVSRIIDELDSSEAQERQSEVYRLRNAQAQDISTAVRSFLDQERQRITQVLGAEAVGTAQRMLEREVAIVAEPVSNTLLLSANPRYFEQIMDLVMRLDQPRPQVLIQVLLAEVTLDNSTDLGIEWSYTYDQSDPGAKTGTDLGVAKELIQAGGGYASVLTGSSYSFLLRALSSAGRLEVLSRPQILTGDNMPAAINIGQKVPLITDSRTTPQGDSINSFNYQNVGVSMSVTPRIGAEGLVQMEISTTNSSLSTSSVTVGGSSAGAAIKAPIINERRANTSVSVQSGQSIIIGGLISTSDDTRTTKVPLLGDIPYLGVFFRKQSKITDRKELLILLTPQVLMTMDEEYHPTTPAMMTRDQLNKSQLKEQFKQDSFRKQLIQPLFPDSRRNNGSNTNGTNGAEGALPPSEQESAPTKSGQSN